MNKNLSLKTKQFFTLIILLYLTACAKHTWEYEPSTPTRLSPLFSKNLTILPITDKRPSSAFLEWSAPLALIPFIPYSKVRVIEYPEKGFIKFEGNPTEKLTQALMWELSNQNLFKKVIYNTQSKQSDYILSGKLKRFRIKSYWSFYGLSLAGIGLWYLGAPAEKIHNDVIIEFKLTDTSGTCYFQKEYTAKSSRLLGFYYNQNIIQFEEPVKHIYLQLVNDLTDTIKKSK